ncbi:XisI protein [Limnothrix sp. FACHB-1083]|uniref:XisI protein n=1 Tax=unclassified Limnothrix TaxID=2632864 RepID=UPI001681A4B3|nr:MULTISPECIES: XisI protein [unclassified Limnothrix]MBD2159429.1 XisI protein [Limnothrix sp. FACHB-1083]MBD2193332.1 XisI protein [Limnothrix sp. FACHB-1088]
MDTSAYLNILEATVQDYHDWANRAASDTDENCLIIDRDRGYCLWLYIGWKNRKRIEKTMIFARLKNGKIWIETDETTDGIATDLMRAGIPNTDIVLGFLAPEERPLSEFAVA